MYENFYGLKEKPFSLTPDPKFLFLSEEHKSAMDHIIYGLMQKEGFTCLTGDVGTGKTTICRALMNIMDEENQIALILNPLVSEDELLKCILQDFGVSYNEGSKKVLIDKLNLFLLEQLSIGKNVVLIIDEAQNLSFSNLEQIRILSNLETEKVKMLSIILVGQAELNQKLKLPQLRQLNQRISVRYYLRPLNKGDVPRYIQHRLVVAGSKGNITFSKGALNSIVKYSKGIPRLINLVCDRALLDGYAKQSYHITKGMVKRGVRSLNNEESISDSKIKTIAQFALISIFILGLISFLSFVAFRSFLWPKTAPKIEESTVEIAKVQETDKIAPRPQVEGGFTGVNHGEYILDKSYPYTIVVASFRDETSAYKEAEKIEKLGYAVYVPRVDSSEGSLFYVSVGRFKNIEAAQEAAERLKELKEFPYVEVIQNPNIIFESEVGR